MVDAQGICQSLPWVRRLLWRSIDVSHDILVLSFLLAGPRLVIEHMNDERQDFLSLDGLDTMA